MNKERLILVVNDDGYNAPGIEALIEVASEFGRVVGVAPKTPQSGASQSITSYSPLYLDTIYKYPEAELYALNGTPVDCIKFATDHLLLSQKVDLVVSGINHGSNASVNVLYSGTMGAAIEGALSAAPAIGFSHMSHAHDIDFTASKHFAREIISSVLAAQVEGLFCLNVNIPDLPLEQIKGIKVARQNRGYWMEEFYARQDPRGRDYYWLTGEYINHEPNATDTDLAAIAEGYVSVVPLQVDMTDYTKLSSTAKMLGV